MMQYEPDFHDATEDFLFNLRRGSSAQSIVATLRQDYSVVLEDPNKQTAFAIAMAQAAWRAGVLYPQLKDEALRAIEMTCANDPTAASELMPVQNELTSDQPARNFGRGGLLDRFRKRGVSA